MPSPHSWTLTLTLTLTLTMTLTQVNIRVMPSPYSWTNHVARYLKLLDPHGTGEVELRTRNPTTGEATLGKVMGQNGQPLLRVDAPNPNPNPNPDPNPNPNPKVMGPNGQPLFRVDAPHGAPSQHTFQYKTCVLVGAGIGVTPCASIMKVTMGPAH